MSGEWWNRGSRDADNRNIQKYTEIYTPVTWLIMPTVVSISLLDNKDVWSSISTVINVMKCNFLSITSRLVSISKRLVYEPFKQPWSIKRWASDEYDLCIVGINNEFYMHSIFVTFRVLLFSFVIKSKLKYNGTPWDQHLSWNKNIVSFPLRKIISLKTSSSMRYHVQTYSSYIRIELVSGRQRVIRVIVLNTMQHSLFLYTVSCPS